MSDIKDHTLDHRRLFATASEQLGYFTAAQAHRAGFSWSLLSYYAATGGFVRIRRRVYRIRDYPSSPHEDEMAAWLAVGKENAVISHESALSLLELGDIIPNTIHITVPRSRRQIRPLTGVTIHTTTRVIQGDDIAIRSGIRLTAAARSILDAAENGIAPDQVTLAAKQAVERGLVVKEQLHCQAKARSRRLAHLVDTALDETRR